MFGGGIISKVLMYILMGPIAMLFGKFKMMDFFIVPMIAPMFEGMFGGSALGGMFGGGGAATAPAT